MGKSKQRASSKQQDNNNNPQDINNINNNRSPKTNNKRRDSSNAAASDSASSSSTNYIRLYPIQDTPTIVKYVRNLAFVTVLALLLGYGFGAMGSVSTEEWRLKLAMAIRMSTFFQLATLQSGTWTQVSSETWRSVSNYLVEHQRQAQAREIAANPSHPHAFDLLREAVVREKGGYVHVDLGFLTPAPCGAARGLGMVSDRYQECQGDCWPGTWQEKQAQKQKRTNKTKPFHQEEVLLKVPLAFQMTRQYALDTLLTLIPAQVQKTSNLHELDDAALLVLLLAHERGMGRYSRWLPYIATLPHVASCGYNRQIRPQILDMVEMLRVEYDVETNGWATELVRAAQYATTIAESLSNDYGEYLETPPGVSSVDNMEWALCTVASRATAGNGKYGALRLVPFMDMINHDSTAGGFVELVGNETFAAGDFVEAHESDAGAFVVRSLRNGRRRPLKVGQEILVNYNVPQYAPLDWLVSTGFVPPERWGKWKKTDRVFPPQRWNSVPENAIPTSHQWNRDAPTVMKRIKDTDPDETF